MNFNLLDTCFPLFSCTYFLLILFFEFVHLFAFSPPTLHTYNLCLFSYSLHHPSIRAFMAIYYPPVRVGISCDIMFYYLSTCFSPPPSFISDTLAFCAHLFSRCMCSIPPLPVLILQLTICSLQLTPAACHQPSLAGSSQLVVGTELPLFTYICVS